MRWTEPGLVAFYNIWPQNEAVYSYNPKARIYTAQST